ncbi:hypothetical protein PYCCODRAFT_709112 [Trametes coccinea BRFM310]|uniref:Uncharacterized protein n=1 Tax=Trametes coccinea (strain BRFM310) TaxID=1353009 RepID=A0A1Y2II71_TRAC3|nr:hypothetical protein PYCCODRAFT_709112 [Trametes coccinea BRFM310]
MDSPRQAVSRTVRLRWASATLVSRVLLNLHPLHFVSAVYVSHPPPLPESLSSYSDLDLVKLQLCYEWTTSTCTFRKTWENSSSLLILRTHWEQ